MKLFQRCLDDRVCTLKRNPLEYLDYANFLHNNLQFTLETPNGSGDHKIKVSEDRKIRCQWYQKSTVTGIILNSRSSAPLQHKKNVIKGTVHRIFIANSD